MARIHENSFFIQFEKYCKPHALNAGTLLSTFCSYRQNLSETIKSEWLHAETIELYLYKVFGRSEEINDKMT